MRYLIYSSYNLTPHLDTELELAKNLIEEGHELFFLKCSKKLDTCFANPEHKRIACEYCQALGTQAYSRLGIDAKHVLSLPDIKVDYPTIGHFETLASLKEYKYKGVDVGLAVASSLVSSIRDHNFDTAKYAERIRISIRTAIYVYEASKVILDEVKPDVVFIFNGRFVESRPLLRLCEQRAVQFYTHERGGQLNRYLLRENSTPHSLEAIHREIEDLWNHAGEKRIEQGRKFFVDRRNKVIQAWKVFTEDQKQGSLPHSFDHSKKNIAIFNSSMDEYEGIAGYKNKIYKDDNDGIASICAAFVNDPSIHFYLRIHPNLKGLQNSQTRQIEQIGKTYKNLTIIGADEEVDSYKLMEAADTIVTFGSTMGIESVFWNKPSVLLGRAMYENIKGLYLPATHDEAVKLLKDNLQPNPDNDAVKFGYWCLNFGKQFKYYTPSGISKGEFMGAPLQVSFYDKVRIRLLSILTRNA